MDYSKVMDESAPHTIKKVARLVSGAERMRQINPIPLTLIFSSVLFDNEPVKPDFVPAS
jgi:hypothetical protein